MFDITAQEVVDATKLIMETVSPGGRVGKTAQAEIQPKKKNGVFKGLTLVCICLDEEKNIPRFIENVMSHRCITRTVVIDGGSTDRSVEMLRQAGAEVYVHPYLQGYHDQQAVQRNISFTYVREGDRCLVMDFDECFSVELATNLHKLLNFTTRYVELSRKTYLKYDDAVKDICRIKDYPDWQPRFFIWEHRYKWIRSPHHVILNAADPFRQQWDILHFEGENKDRAGLEMKWKTMHDNTMRYYGNPVEGKCL
jgi:glycosyltransferase involved in cell wall biosynthesis